MTCQVTAAQIGMPETTTGFLNYMLFFSRPGIKMSTSTSHCGCLFSWKTPGRFLPGIHIYVNDASRCFFEDPKITKKNDVQVYEGHISKDTKLAPEIASKPLPRLAFSRNNQGDIQPKITQAMKNSLVCLGFGMILILPGYMGITISHYRGNQPEVFVFTALLPSDW